MSQPNPSNLPDAFKELLLEDYKYLADSFWKNEQTGETRVNWYIGVCTAMLAGIVALITSDHELKYIELSWTLIAIMSAVLVFGIMTLYRVNKRDGVTNTYKKAMDKIRGIFQLHASNGIAELTGYKPFSESIIGRTFGGLRHMVMAINSMLAAGIVSVLLQPDDITLVNGLVVVGSFVIASFLQTMWFKAVEYRLDIHQTHAGGIVYKCSSRDVQYLLVGTSRKEPNVWVFPKGHIECSEKSDEAALREVKEETGVSAKIIRPIGWSRFRIKSKKVVVEYYLMEWVSESQQSESRDTFWADFETAYGKLSYRQNRKLLREAHKSVSRGR